MYSSESSSAVLLSLVNYSSAGGQVDEEVIGIPAVPAEGTACGGGF